MSELIKGNKSANHLFLKAAAVILVYVFLCSGAAAVSPRYGDKITPGIYDAIEGLSSLEVVPVWIFFRDDGPEIREGSVSRLPGGVSRRCEGRVARRGALGPGTKTMWHPDTGSLLKISDHVQRIRYVSKYLNAVSADVRVGDIAGLASLDAVTRIQPLRRFKRGPEPARRSPSNGNTTGSFEDPWFTKYGPSLDQLAMTRSSDLLEMGYDGSGMTGGGTPVMICIMDTGFELTHEAFSRLDVLIQYDFVDFDSVTAQEPGDYPGQSKHGTTVLGSIGGYHEGDLIGPAWGAQFILAKTEIEGQEIILEEDKWIAALEWADSIGTDIVTTSVGYLNWYSQDDLDGETALITVAADIAASRGITVVAAMGNYGWNGETSMIAPADGDSVISVGAVNRYGDIANFSSRGPTADGRIKPDIVGLGLDVVSVSYDSQSGYSRYNGTSYATPLIAGLCAQILEIHPDWSPAELADSLRASASRSDSPDNTFGWGLPNGLTAAGLEDGGVLETPYFAIGYPNPFTDNIMFHLFMPGWEVVDLDIYDCRGALVVSLADELPVKWGETIEWDGRRRSGARVPPGVYFMYLRSRSIERTVKLVRIGR